MPLLPRASGGVSQLEVGVGREDPLDLLFRERGFELYWEMQRRTDMIRFGKFEGTWTEKNSTDRNKRVFPIPQTAIDGASNLPGYLRQNPGY